MLVVGGYCSARFARHHLRLTFARKQTSSHVFTDGISPHKGRLSLLVALSRGTDSAWIWKMLNITVWAGHSVSKGIEEYTFPIVHKIAGSVLRADFGGVSSFSSTHVRPFTDGISPEMGTRFSTNYIPTKRDRKRYIFIQKFKQWAVGLISFVKWRLIQNLFLARVVMFDSVRLRTPRSFPMIRGAGKHVSLSVNSAVWRDLRQFFCEI